MDILGINMDCITYDEMFHLFDEWIGDDISRSYRLAVINVHICVISLFDKQLRDLYNSADLVGIDSMPFVKWARVFHNKKTDRLTPPDLLLEISQKSKEKGYTFYFYGGYPDAPKKMEDFLKSRFGNIKVVGTFSPPFRSLTSEEDEEICKMINDAKPDILWIGLGSPKQDIWIRDHIEKIRGSIIIPSGAAFDFYSGRIKRAPKWIRNIGFEWLYRLTQDFRRLFVRYTIYNIIFLFVFFLQILRVITFDEEGFLKILGIRVSSRDG